MLLAAILARPSIPVGVPRRLTVECVVCDSAGRKIAPGFNLFPDPKRPPSFYAQRDDMDGEKDSILCSVDELTQGLYNKSIPDYMISRSKGDFINMNTSSASSLHKTWRKSRSYKPDFQNPNPTVCPPTWFFDNLAFIGDAVVGCFLIKTEVGLVLLDCMNPDARCKRLIESGIAQLGESVEDLHAIIISHGHGDHFGNAEYFQRRYGAQIYMSDIDYTFAKHMPSSLPWEPIHFQADAFLQDGAFLTFGTTAIRTVFTPGHTKGCYSFIVPVTDEGRPHHMALWGGSGIMPDTDTEEYHQSLLKFTGVCREMHVDGEISTHPCLDMGLARYELARQITDGMPNPFVLGEEGYHYYEQQFYNYVVPPKRSNPS